MVEYLEYIIKDFLAAIASQCSLAAPRPTRAERPTPPLIPWLTPQPKRRSSPTDFGRLCPRGPRASPWPLAPLYSVWQAKKLELPSHSLEVHGFHKAPLHALACSMLLNAASAGRVCASHWLTALISDGQRPAGPSSPLLQSTRTFSGQPGMEQGPCGEHDLPSTPERHVCNLNPLAAN